ncbi:hypothetical protein [Scrofimicrobium canadense]|uniref:hypothetical protein n=1 Tax=Scrofimicrobium canadense TaxID=2652290 RepID=UPI00197D2530|nr:hypothetical protein [Scrofimicrobium canadense]
MVGAQGGDIVLVAHGGANAPVSVIVDRHPEIIRCVIWVDFGPVSSVRAFALELPKVIAEIPSPLSTYVLNRLALKDSVLTILKDSLP